MLDLATPKHAHADQRLRTEPIIWLSTTRPDGLPHLVPVWFWWDGATVLIFSQPDAQKIRNLRHSPHVMLALEAANEGEDVVMLEGRAELLAEPMAEVVPLGYGEKYASLFTRMGSSVDRMAAEYTQAIRVTPSRFRVW